MGLTAFTNGHSSSLGSETFFGSYTANGDNGNCGMGGSCCGNCYTVFRWSYGPLPASGFNETSRDSPGGECLGAGNFQATISVERDRVIEFRARAVNDDCSGSPSNGSIQSLKTLALSPTANAPSISVITFSSATITCVFNPGVTESNFSVQLQYRRFGETAWTNFGVDSASGTSIVRSLTGLLGNTTYEVRLSGVRNTSNENSWVSVTTAFTTLSNAPEVITTTASVVTNTTAILNGTIDPNGLAVRVRFGWQSVAEPASPEIPANWANLTAYQNFSGDIIQSFEQDISGLAQSTSYFFAAFVEWASPTFNNGDYGGTVTLNTPGDPAVNANLEDHMQIHDFDGHYGVATTIEFMLSSPAATSSDRCVTTAPGSLFAPGDIKVSKDGGSFTNAANSVTQVAASNPTYSLILSASEMSAERIIVQFRDQDGPAFRDAVLRVRTKHRLGQVLVDATQIGGAASAMKLTAASGGYGLEVMDATVTGKIKGVLDSMVDRTNILASGGASTATLDASASATNDYYNGDILLLYQGTGAGQSRVITDYDGSSKQATVNSSWAVNPDNTTRYLITPGNRAFELTIPELAAIPAAGANAAVKLQFCFQRFAFKVTQTATLQTLYTSTGTTLGTRAVSDDGTTQEIAKVV